jgi:hypothetical protein
LQRRCSATARGRAADARRHRAVVRLC